MKSQRLKQQFGNYRLLSLLGQGGFSEVYLGEHVYLKTQAAIKILTLPLEQDELAHFLSEARIIAHLDHPHILRVLDFGLEDTIPFLVLAYAPHGSMRQRYSKGAALPLATITSITDQIASALAHAHAQQLIHGDVKPENMLLGRNEEALLSDFGVAVVASHSIHRSDISGTVAYMAPEQLRGEACFASDQYALGIVVYEWLCGNRPFAGAFSEIVAQHLHAAPPSLREIAPQLSPAIEQVVMRALAKEPQQRFADVVEFASALAQACQSRQPQQLNAGEVGDQGDTVTMKEVATMHIPFYRNPYFTGREELVKRISTTLNQLARPAAQAIHSPAIVAITGLAGIGKTQVAIEYAYRYHDSYTTILWARADSSETLLADIVHIARHLKLANTTSSDPNASEVQSSEQDLQQTVQAFADWLAIRENWLLILDNIEDMSLLNRVVPPTGKGHVLLTTRAQSTGTLAQRIEVETMTRQEAILFLLCRSKLYAPGTREEHISRADYIEAQDICHAMGMLPLALDQAGAYIEETGCLLHHYLQQFRQQRATLLQQRGESSQLHPDSLTTTLLLSIEKVEQANPAAVDLLRLCAFLQADSIDEEMLAGTVHAGYTLDSLIAALRKYSLVSRNTDNRSLSLHRLVQAVVRDHMEPETQRAWAERALRVVNQALPDGEKVTSWPRCERLMPHANACLQHIEQWGLISAEAARLLDQVGLYLLIHGHYSQAQQLLQKALTMREAMPGTDQYAIIETINNLASCFFVLGAYAQAETLFSRVLATSQDIYGSLHTEVANAHNNMALLYHKRGMYSNAERHLEQALSIWEQLRVEMHPDLARTLNNLAMLYHQQGRLREAEQYYLRGLAIWEGVYGPTHPDLAVHLNNLAALYSLQHKEALAQPLFQRALDIRKRTLGPEHPITANSLIHLARSCQSQWKYSEAEMLFKQALTIRKRVLGPEHPETAHSLCSLAKLYLLQGKHTQAESLYMQALAIRERALGPDHPDVAILLKNYAILLMSMKRKEEAVQLSTRAKAIRARQAHL